MKERIKAKYLQTDGGVRETIALIVRTTKTSCSLTLRMYLHREEAVRHRPLSCRAPIHNVEGVLPETVKEKSGQHLSLIQDLGYLCHVTVEPDKRYSYCKVRAWSNLEGHAMHTHSCDGKAFSGSPSPRPWCNPQIRTGEMHWLRRPSSSSVQRRPLELFVVLARPSSIAWLEAVIIAETVSKRRQSWHPNSEGLAWASPR